MAYHSHVDLTQVEEYVRYGKYPACMSGSNAKGLKKNFRRACKSYSMGFSLKFGEIFKNFKIGSHF